MEDQPQYYENTTQNGPRGNLQAENVKSLVNMAGIISLIFGILFIILGIFTLFTLVFGVIDIVIWYFCKDINRLIDQGNYTEAKSKTMLWMILGLILGGLIPGILLLLAYMKFDELQPTNQQYYLQPQQQTASPPPAPPPSPPPAEPEPAPAPPQPNEKKEEDTEEKHSEN